MAGSKSFISAPKSISPKSISPNIPSSPPPTAEPTCLSASMRSAAILLSSSKDAAPLRLLAPTPNWAIAGLGITNPSNASEDMPTVLIVRVTMIQYNIIDAISVDSLVR
mmetsp:Transcript_12142/g.21607  ORF Transcript_12142/g.21607 Transcript_12142/m.21607 type:complete len:109 (-) Transcript_12142:19-345(-)